MAKQSALTTLIELAERDADDAAKRVGAANQALDEAQQKLQMLLGYRDEYARKLETAQVSGITPQAYHNFVAFIGKLDNAVGGQQEVVKHAEYRCGQAKADWQKVERKRLSYRTLSERAAAQALAVENKRDQKLMDEHAARQAFHKR